jgi:ATP-dependent Clp protease ATP-binding subunit ClpC
VTRLLDAVVPCYVAAFGPDPRFVARPLWSSPDPSVDGSGDTPAAALAALGASLERRMSTLEPGAQDEWARITWSPPGLRVARYEVPFLRGWWGTVGPGEVLAVTYRQGAEVVVLIPGVPLWLLVPGSDELSGDELARWIRRDRAHRPGASPSAGPRVLRSRSERVVHLPLRVLAERPPLGAHPIGPGADPDDRASPREALEALTTELPPPSPDELAAWCPDPLADELASALVRPGPHPLALVGPSGSGRTTRLRQAIQRLAEAWEQHEAELVRAALRGVPAPPAPPAPPVVRHLDPRRIVAGQSIVGAWQRRLTTALRYLAERSGAEASALDVLYLDDPVALATAGQAERSPLSATTLLLPWLDRRAFPVVIEATPDQWERLSELARPFVDRFRTVRVEGTDEPRTRALAARALARARDFGAPDPSVLDLLLDLDVRFGGARVQPGRRLAGLATILGRGGETVHLGSGVEARMVRGLGYAADLATGRPLPDGPLRERLSARLVGQPAAIDALASAVHAIRSGLRPPRRPVASWLFLGPPGVGKTEAARLLAEVLFDDPSRLLRFDLNTFADAAAPSRLIGGFGQPGLLTTAARLRPAAVLLLDEVDKAHPLVHDLLLQLLDEGRLTDAEGRTAWFTDMVVVLTSNLGAEVLGRSRGFEPAPLASADAERAYRAELEAAFRPELVNRFDRVVVFRPLGRPELTRIARLELERLWQRHGVRLRRVLPEVDDAVLGAVVDASVAAHLGARGLRRELERALVAGLADVLGEHPPERPLRLHIDRDGSRVRFSAEPLRVVARRPPAPTAAIDPADRLRALLGRLEALRPAGSVELRSPPRPEDRAFIDHLSLANEVDALLQAVEADRPPAPPAGTEQALLRLRPTEVTARRPSRARADPRAAGRRERAAFHVERSQLREARRPLPIGWEARVSILERCVDAAAGSGPRATEVSVRVRFGRAADAEAYVAAYARALDRLAERAAGRWPAAALAAWPSPVAAVAEGAGLAALLRCEEGLVWWRGDERPVVLEVRARAPGAAAGPPVDRVLREVERVRGELRVTDLATGASCALDELPEALSAWILEGCEP